MSNELVATNANGEKKTTSLIQVSGSTPGNMDAMLKGLGKAKAGINIAPEYFEFSKPGESVRGLFVGYKQVATKEGEVLDGATWMDEEKNMYINCGMALVGALTSANIQPWTPIEIEFLGTKKVEKGTMNKFAVRILTIE